MDDHKESIELHYRVRSQPPLDPRRNFDRTFRDTLVLGDCVLCGTLLICGVWVFSTSAIAEWYAVGRTKCEVFRLYAVQFQAR